jgi:hypothetical protein
MTPEQVTLVQQTFGQVAPIADKAAEVFYDRLFEVAPAAKPLFQGDMAEQRRKLMATLAAVVRGLSDLPSVLPAAMRSPSATSTTAHGRNIIPWSARCCCGRWSADLGRSGRRRRPPPGPLPIRPCRAS